MRADDEGFINNPRKIQRMIGGSADDLNLLKAKNFLIPFESGVVVIKHWKIHNYIQKDRFKETVYQDEKSLLNVKKNGTYTLALNELDTNCIHDVSKVDTNCIHDVSKMDTQDRLGKDRLGKDRLGKDRLGKDATKVACSQSEPIDYQSIIDDFNSICIDFPRVKSLSDKRKKTIRARLNTYSREELRNVFEKAQSSDFLKGKNNRDWQANFDWLLNDANIAKVLDGNYDNKFSGKASGSTKAQELDDFYKMASDWAKG